MTIQIDTREKEKAIQAILSTFDGKNVEYFKSKLFVGDYMNLDNPRLVVDRKQNLQEICNNVTQDRARFIRELKRAKQYGIKIVFLIEHGENVRQLDDVLNWKNPRLKTSPKAVSGVQLHKKLKIISDTFDTEFLFCSKAETGRAIIKILGGLNG